MTKDQTDENSRPADARNQSGYRDGHGRTWWWAVAYLALSICLVSGAWPNLANFPPVSADEVWIMSASFKLANEGVLGSDLFVGLQGADRHYFLALPVQHLIQAAFFRTFGPGIAQARAPSVLAGVALLCAVGWLVYSWSGLAGSVVTGVLLVFWRSNLVATDPRPPLLALAQSGRYDVMVLCCWWLVILVFNRHLDQPRRATAVLSGFLAGTAALTQFYGAGVLVCCAATLLLMRARGKVGPWHVREMAIGAFIPILLYVAYVAAHVTDFIRQAMLRSSRLQFYSPRFYVTNLLEEWRRFDWLLAGSYDLIGTWALILALPLAFVAGARLLRGGNPIAFMSTFFVFLSLALLDSTKARIYASLLLPSACLGLAAALVSSDWTIRRGFRPGVRVVAGCVLLVWIVVDGLEGYRFIAREGPRVSPYADAGRRIAE